MTCMQIESSFLHFEEQAPKILQEATLEGYKFEANSFPTKELTFEITSPIPEVEEVILTSFEDEEGVVRPEKIQFFLKKGKIVILVKNLKFILWISDDETDFTVGIFS